MFASIYHPVGTAIVVAAAINRGRTLAFNGVCGNIGVALAAGITAALTAWIGWRGAFLVPAVVCVATGDRLFRDGAGRPQAGRRPQRRARRAAGDVDAWSRCSALFILIGTTAGLVFNTVTIALPKVIDERIGSGISLVAVGGIATAVFLCGAVAQFTVGRILEKYPAHLVFAFTGLMQFIGVVWVVYATGYALLGCARLRHGVHLRAGDGQRFRHRPLHRRRLARPRLCGALLHHLSDLRRGDHHDRVPAQPRRLRPGARRRSR